MCFVYISKISAFFLFCRRHEEEYLGMIIRGRGEIKLGYLCVYEGFHYFTSSSLLLGIFSFVSFAYSFIQNAFFTLSTAGVSIKTAWMKNCCFFCRQGSGGCVRQMVECPSHVYFACTLSLVNILFCSCIRSNGDTFPYIFAFSQSEIIRSNVT